MTQILTHSQSLVTPTEDSDFYGIFLDQPSWSPIYLTRSGWVTSKSRSGKKVPLTRSNIVRAYSKKAIAQIIGKRFSRLTNYIMLDIDAGSIYHPFNGALLEQIFDAMEDLGLCRYLILRSSASGGLHIYFPLPKPVGSYAIASVVHGHLSKRGINIKAGQCELFPNKKSFGSDYNGHRLPLQKGSCIIDVNLSPISDSKQDFVHQWNLCAEGQDAETLEELCGQPSSTHKPKTLEFTAKGQSNSLMLRVAKLGVKEGITNAVKLSEYIQATIKGLNGFDAFASRETKSDLTKWSQRVAKWALKEQRFTKAKNARSYHKAVADEARNRIEKALQFVVESIPLKGLSFSKIGKALIEAGKELFGVGFSMRTLYKYKALIIKSVSVALSCEVLLSKAEKKEESRSNTQSKRTDGLGKAPTHKEQRPLPNPLNNLQWAQS